MIQAANNPQMGTHSRSGALRFGRYAFAPADGHASRHQDRSATGGARFIIDYSDVTGPAPAGSLSRRRDNPSVAAARPVFNTKGLINLRRRPARCSSSLARPGAASLVGFVGSPEELADIIVFDRAGAFAAAARFNSSAPDHLCQDRVEPLENHNHAPSSVTRYLSKVARGEVHDVHKIQASGAFHEC